MVAMIVAVALLVPATVACLAYLVPTLAGLLPRRRAVVVPTSGFAILIPAHDEETTLPATLAALAALNYDPELVRVYVVADNCTDRTVAVAKKAGAVCLIRNDLTRRGKGYAVAFGLERIRRTSFNVLLVLDADCHLNPDALCELDAVFSQGADAVQCAVRSRNADAGPGGYVAAVGAAVDEVVAAGWDRLGRSVPLRGTGMAIRFSVLDRVPWVAFGAAEDAEYTRQLRAAGVRIRHASGAIVSCDAPSQTRDLYQQRRRWRAAGVLASKPLVLSWLLLTLLVAVPAGFVVWPLVLASLTCAVYLRATLTVGITAHRLGLLLRSPVVVARLGWLAVAGLFQTPPTTWDRTPRPLEERRAA